jgi:hypothetical protein
MGDLSSKWWFRAAVLAGLTYAAYRWLPVGTIGKTVTLAIGGVAVASTLPVVGSVIGGGALPKLPVAAAKT